MSETTSGDRAEPGGLPSLDPLIHAQARLRIMAVLASLPEGDQLAFPRLQELVDVTAGNLSTHLRKLEDADYVDVTKTHRGRTPVTWVALSRKGRRAYEDYVEAVQAYLNAPTTDATTEQAEREEEPG